MLPVCSTACSVTSCVSGWLAEIQRFIYSRYIQSHRGCELMQKTDASFSYTSCKEMCVGVGEWGHSVGLCAYLCFLFCFCVQRLIMCWAKDLEDREMKRLCPNFCHRIWLVMQSSAASYTSDTKYYPLFIYKTKKKHFFFFSSASLWG